MEGGLSDQPFYGAQVQALKIYEAFMHLPPSSAIGVNLHVEKVYSNPVQFAELVIAFIKQPFRYNALAVNGK